MLAEEQAWNVFNLFHSCFCELTEPDFEKMLSTPAGTEYCFQFKFCILSSSDGGTSVKKTHSMRMQDSISICDFKKSFKILPVIYSAVIHI